MVKRLNRFLRGWINGEATEPIPSWMDQLLPNCELQDDGSQLDGVDKAASENEANEGVEELEGPA